METIKTIKIAAMGNITLNKDGTITMYLMEDKDKDITHVVELNAYAAKSFLQVAAQVLWMEQLLR